MDPANYKDLVVSRGYKYHYYAVPAKEDQLTIVFVHGWPNTSRAWRLIVPFFEEKGYGVIVPDVLGYGGTDRPTDYNEYQYSLLDKDLIDILDAEGVEKAAAVGHDWYVVHRLFVLRLLSGTNDSVGVPASFHVSRISIRSGS